MAQALLSGTARVQVQAGVAVLDHDG